LGYAASYGLEAVCFRYFNVYGVRQDPSSPYSGVLSIFTDRMRAGAPVTVFGDGEQTRDFVSVHDVAQFNCSAVTAEGIRIGRYNVCTGTEVSLNDVLEICRHSYPDAPAPSYCNAREGDIRHSVGDPQRLKQNLGMRASVPFARGLNALISGKLL
jgi:UDP-glucose 4-epimerase